MLKQSQLKKQFVTIEEARKVLGSRAKRMSDKQIESLLSTLRFMSNKIIESIVKED